MMLLKLGTTTILTYHSFHHASISDSVHFEQAREPFSDSGYDSYKYDSDWVPCIRVLIIISEVVAFWLGRDIVRLCA